MKAGYVFLAAFLGAASAADLFQITVQIGDDSAAGVIARLDKLERVHKGARNAFGASVDEKGVFCLAYSDPHGRDEIAKPFSAGNDVVFTEDSDPVDVQAFYCADSRDKLLTPPGQRPSEGDSGNGNAGDDGEEDSVKLQFRTGFKSFTRGDVPVGEVFSLEDSDLGDTVVEAFVMSVKGAKLEGAKCQLFKDSDGKDPLGDAFSIYPMTLGVEPKTAGSVKCKFTKE